jgi:Transglycosylase-like domain
MVIVRRVLLLTLISLTGIALLAPLSAQSAATLPAPPDDQLLARQPEPRADASRGGVLSARAASMRGSATGRAEAVATGGAQRRPDVRMEAAIVVVPTAPPPPAPAPPAATYSGSSVWDDLARCESGGNWAINTGNGYYGGLQFSLATWNGYGGAEFAEYPHQATRAEQITVAERLRAARGYQPWPACRAKLGLP